MSKPYEFYLRGTDTYFKIVPSSYTVVPTGAADAAPNTIAGPPASTTDWITVEAFGADVTLTNDGEEYTTPSAQMFKDSEPRWTFTIRTRRYRYPSEYADYKELMQTLAKPYLYLVSKTYDFDLPATNNAIPVVCNFTVDHDYTYGKSVTMNLTHRARTDALP